MSYLLRGNKPDAYSGSGMSRRAAGSRKFLSLIVTLLILSGLFFLVRKPIANSLYGLKGLFVPDAPLHIALAPDVLNAQLTALQLENEELRQLVGKRMAGDEAAAAAEAEVVSSVLMRPPQLPFDSLVINSGTDEGIIAGDQVYAFSSFPIGEIVAVTARTSIVRLFSAPGNKVEVLIGTTTTAVLAEGKGGGNFFLKLPKVTEISKGDIVMRTYLPPEAFSTIESVDSTEGEAYTYAYFKLPVNIHNIVYVIVKKNSAR